jgi:hypothetical protein
MEPDVDAPVDWRALAARVIVEACAAHPEDTVFLIGDPSVAEALAVRAGRVVRGERLADAPEGTSIVVLHWTFRRFSKVAQEALLVEAANLLPPRGLLVIGDLMWSFPLDQIDAPEQFGDAYADAPTCAALEAAVRRAGFLPDLHRFSPGVGVMVAVRA